MTDLTVRTKFQAVVAPKLRVVDEGNADPARRAERAAIALGEFAARAEMKAYQSAGPERMQWELAMRAARQQQLQALSRIPPPAGQQGRLSSPDRDASGGARGLLIWMLLCLGFWTLFFLFAFRVI